MTHPQRQTTVCLLAALLSSAIACSGWPVPGKEEAAQVLRQSPPFTSTSTTRTLGLYQRRCIWPTYDENHGAWVKALGTVEQDGVIKITRRPAAPSDCGVLNAEIVTITLTEAGQKAMAQWPNRPVNDDLKDANNLPAWNFPLRQRRFVDVTGIGAADPKTGLVPVEFTWELVTLHGGSVVQNRGTAMFQYEKTGWRIDTVKGIEDR
jgi:hypothetical protein